MRNDIYSDGRRRFENLGGKPKNIDFSNTEPKNLLPRNRSGIEMKARFKMDDERKICPYCREEIRADAVKCPLCKSRIRPWRAEAPWIRDFPERWWLGVASLLAHQTKTSVEIWRALFVLGIFFYGAGPLLYLTIWALTPEREGEQAPLRPLLQKISKQFAKFGVKTRDASGTNG